MFFLWQINFLIVAVEQLGDHQHGCPVQGVRPDRGGEGDHPLWGGAARRLCAPGGAQGRRHCLLRLLYPPQ